MTGTESLLQLSADLRQTAPNVRAWFDHTKAAELMEKAAEMLGRSEPTIRKMVRDGTFKLNACGLIPIEQVDRAIR